MIDTLATAAPTTETPATTLSEQTRELRSRLSRTLIPKLEKYILSEFGDIEAMTKRQATAARKKVCRRLGVCWGSYTNWTKRGILPTLGNLMHIKYVVSSSADADPAEALPDDQDNDADLAEVEIPTFPEIDISEDDEDAASFKAYFLQVDKYFDLASQHMSTATSDDELCAAKWRACMSRMGK